MEDFRFYEESWNEWEARQPICMDCTERCADCIFATLTGAWHRSSSEQCSDCNDECFDV